MFSNHNNMFRESLENTNKNDSIIEKIWYTLFIINIFLCIIGMLTNKIIFAIPFGLQIITSLMVVFVNLLELILED